MFSWLFEAAIGPAVVALPVNWAADKVASAAQRWFRRLHGTDSLSRMLRAATGTSVSLTRGEFDAVRRLLEDEQTWVVLGRGTIESLVARLADCLPPREDRTSTDSLAAAHAIAHGLLEFVAADLDPAIFQHLLLVRLQRLSTDQASALDRAMLGLHVEVLAGFADVMGEFKRVLDRLPPGPAQIGEVVVYLMTLIDWLNTDDWPRDRRFDGPKDVHTGQPMLTPAAIERELRITTHGKTGEQDLDADRLARECRRLVILGAAGSGKTWLAKRAARLSAEKALQDLVSGMTLDEVELPMYTTCSRLFASSGSAREAAVSSALDQLNDLGGSRLTAAVHRLFADRNAPTLLVIDSLDEATGSDDPLRQADRLPWRIVLTSRPSSWNRQIALREERSDQIGEIQPLRYPQDVEPFIRHWFSGRPEGERLAEQIAQRTELQQAATVPLILSFYCVLGGSQPLPGVKRDLYAKVLRCMLTGRWRGTQLGADSYPQVETCLDLLRAWAWEGAEDHPISGVGMWADDFPTERVELDGVGVKLTKASRDALDHVATPISPPGIEQKKFLRRFIHRSVREHLVAEYVARLPEQQSAQILLPHVWYDPDWEYSAPAAVAMHPQRDLLLKDLVCRAANSDQIPDDLSSIDAGWEFRRFLARMARESNEVEWSGESAEIISHARLELALSGRIGELRGDAGWDKSDSRVRKGLLDMLVGQTDARKASKLGRMLAQLTPSAQEARQARLRLLTLITGQADESAAFSVDTLLKLDPTDSDRRKARGALLHQLSGLLARQAARRAAEVLLVEESTNPRPEDKRTGPGESTHNGESGKPLETEEIDTILDEIDEVLRDQHDAGEARTLASRLALLNPTAEERRQAIDVLTSLAAGTDDDTGIYYLLHAITEFANTWVDRRQAVASLLGLLTDQVNPVISASDWEDCLVRLDPTTEEKLQARRILLKSLAELRDGVNAYGLARGLAELGPEPVEEREALEGLLSLLDSESDPGSVVTISMAIAQLNPAADTKRHVRQVLLEYLIDQSDPYVVAVIAEGAIKLGIAARDRDKALDSLLRLATNQTEGYKVKQLLHQVIELCSTAEQKRRACQVILKILADQADGSAAYDLVDFMLRLGAAPEDRREARQVLLTHHPDDLNPHIRATALLRLGPTADDKRRARRMLLAYLAGEKPIPFAPYMAPDLANLLTELDPTEEDLYRARQFLLAWLASFPYEGQASTLTMLSPTADDKRQARQALLRSLSENGDEPAARSLMKGIAEVDPTIHDLINWKAWAAAPTAELLTTVRRNSAPSDWISCLGMLAPLASGSSSKSD